jgi:hypothetical protein
VPNFSFSSARTVSRRSLSFSWLLDRYFELAFCQLRQRSTGWFMKVDTKRACACLLWLVVGESNDYAASNHAESIMFTQSMRQRHRKHIGPTRQVPSSSLLVLVRMTGLSIMGTRLSSGQLARSRSRWLAPRRSSAAAARLTATGKQTATANFQLDGARTNLAQPGGA